MLEWRALRSLIHLMSIFIILIHIIIIGLPSNCQHVLTGKHLRNAAIALLEVPLVAEKWRRGVASCACLEEAPRTLLFDRPILLVIELDLLLRTSNVS